MVSYNLHTFAINGSFNKFRYSGRKIAVCIIFLTVLEISSRSFNGTQVLKRQSKMKIKFSVKKPIIIYVNTDYFL